MVPYFTCFLDGLVFIDDMLHTGKGANNSCERLVQLLGARVLPARNLLENALTN